MNTQPQIDAAHQLLHTGYDHLGLLLDLYGERDADGYDIQAVTLTGVRGPAGEIVDLSEFVSRVQFGQMSAWCDRHLPSAHQLLLVSQLDARAERLQWERMAVAA